MGGCYAKRSMHTGREAAGTLEGWSRVEEGAGAEERSRESGWDDDELIVDCARSGDFGIVFSIWFILSVILITFGSEGAEDLVTLLTRDEMMRHAVQQRTINARKPNQRNNPWRNDFKSHCTVQCFIGISFTMNAVWVRTGSQSIVWAAVHLRSRGARSVSSITLCMIVHGLVVIFLARTFLARQWCWEMLAHAHIDTDHRVMSHDGMFEKLLSVDTYYIG
jgi:hypothetical protein